MGLRRRRADQHGRQADQPGRPAGEGPGEPRGLFERLLFSVMGPPQLGDLNAPPSAAPDPAAELCPRCGQPWDRHERVSTSSRGYLTCPPEEPGTAS